MTDDLSRHAREARDAARLEARQAADALPSAAVLHQRAMHRKRTRRVVGVLGVVALASLSVATTNRGGEKRSTVTASVPDSQAGAPLLVETPTAVTTSSNATTTAKPRPAVPLPRRKTAPTATTPPSIRSACQASAVAGAIGFARIGDRGLIATASGAISISTDDGSNWHSVCLPPDAASATFQDVFFLPDGRHGWIVGSFPPKAGSSESTMVVLHTEDGGDHWTQGRVPSSPGSLEGVSFYDSNHGWAVGSGSAGAGALLRTADGGASWVESTPPDAKSNPLQAIHFNNTADGWAVGLNIVLGTTDGGTTWVAHTLQRGGYGTYLEDIGFTDSMHGFAVGGDHPLHDETFPLLLVTSDGGQNWSAAALDHESSGALRAIDIVSPNLIYVGGDNGLLLRSTDGGMHWDKAAQLTVQGPLGTGNPGMAPTLAHVLFLNPDHGWVANPFLGDHAAGALCATTDGGQTWGGHTLHGQTFACNNSISRSN